MRGALARLLRGEQLRSREVAEWPRSPSRSSLEAWFVRVGGGKEGSDSTTPSPEISRDSTSLDPLPLSPLCPIAMSLLAATSCSNLRCPTSRDLLAARVGRSRRARRSGQPRRRRSWLLSYHVLPASLVLSVLPRALRNVSWLSSCVARANRSLLKASLLSLLPHQLRQLRLRPLHSHPQRPPLYRRHPPPQVANPCSERVEDRKSVV